MNQARARKAKAKQIALQLHANYRGLVEASGQENIEFAAIRLGDTFNTNVEFIINVLRDYGGLDAKFEPMTTAEKPALPSTPAILLQDN